MLSSKTKLNFADYLRRDVLKEEIAEGMGKLRVDPYAVIYTYLEWQEHQSADVYTEGLRNLFSRLGAGWKAFWNWKQHQSPTDKVTAAKQSLQELEQMLSQYEVSDPKSISLILSGIKQITNLLSKLEPHVQRAEPNFMHHYVPGGGGFNPREDPHEWLPDDIMKTWDAIMQKRVQITKLPEDDSKKQQLIQNNNQLLAFRDGLEDQYQTLDPQDPKQSDIKNRIGYFLRYLDTDTSFRRIGNVLNYGPSRPAGKYPHHWANN